MRATCGNLVVFLVFVQAGTVLGLYEIVQEYVGQELFVDWDYYGKVVDSQAGENVAYAGRINDMQEKLSFVDPSSGHAIVRLGTTGSEDNLRSPVYPSYVGIISKDAYPIGSLIVIDAIHIPYGCALCPTFRTLGNELGSTHANDVEISLIEGINGMTANDMWKRGFIQSDEKHEDNNALTGDCHGDVRCKFEQTKKPNSFGKGFSEAGGGVFALQVGISGISMWFWSRQAVPVSIAQAKAHGSLDIADWGQPSAAYPAPKCNIDSCTKPQKLVLDIALCGQWAETSELYAMACPGGDYISNPHGDGSRYATAYWEISYIRTFLLKAPDLLGRASSSSVRGPESVSGYADAASPPALSRRLPFLLPWTHWQDSDAAHATIFNPHMPTTSRILVSTAKISDHQENTSPPVETATVTVLVTSSLIVGSVVHTMPDIVSIISSTATESSAVTEPNTGTTLLAPLLDSSGITSDSLVVTTTINPALSGITPLPMSSREGPSESSATPYSSFEVSSITDSSSTTTVATVGLNVVMGLCMFPVVLLLLF